MKKSEHIVALVFLQHEAQDNIYYSEPLKRVFDTTKQ